MFHSCVKLPEGSRGCVHANKIHLLPRLHHPHLRTLPVIRHASLRKKQDMDGIYIYNGEDNREMMGHVKYIKYPINICFFHLDLVCCQICCWKWTTNQGLLTLLKERGLHFRGVSIDIDILMQKAVRNDTRWHQQSPLSRTIATMDPSENSQKTHNWHQFRSYSDILKT